MVWKTAVFGGDDLKTVVRKMNVFLKDADRAITPTIITRENSNITLVLAYKRDSLRLLKVSKEKKKIGRSNRSKRP